MRPRTQSDRPRRSSPTTRVSSPANVDKITFKIYQDADAAYNDVLANNLDVTDEIPAERSDRRQVQDGPPRPRTRRRSRASSRRSPSRRPVDPRLRRTRSCARPSRWRSTASTIIKQIFNGTRDAGHRLGLPGRRRLQGRASAVSSAVYDPAKRQGAAATRPAASRATDHPDLQRRRRPQGPWTEAACNSHQAGARRRVRGRRRVVDFATFRTEIGDRKMKGCSAPAGRWTTRRSRTSWSRSTRPARRSNDGDYANPDFDELLAEAAAAADADGGQRARTRRPRRCSPRTCRSSRCGTATASVGWSDRSTSVEDQRRSARSTYAVDHA